MTATTNAGWHPDPYRAHEQRYYDGTAWTEHVADAGRQTVDPPGPGPVIPPRAGASSPVTSPPMSPHYRAPLPAANGVTRPNLNGWRLGAGLGGALLVLGAFLPWVKISVFGASLEAAGTDGSNDGWFSLAAGAAVILLVLFSGRRWAGILALIAGGVAAFVGVHDFSQVRDAIDAAEAKSGLVHASVGIGLWLTLVGAAVVLVAAIVITVRSD